MRAPLGKKRFVHKFCERRCFQTFMFVLFAQTRRANRNNRHILKLEEETGLAISRSSDNGQGLIRLLSELVDFCSRVGLQPIEAAKNLEYRYRTFRTKIEDELEAGGSFVLDDHLMVVVLFSYFLRYSSQ